MIHTMKNKYIIRSRISEKKFREILKYFCFDIEASKIAKITQISEQTLCKIFKQIRILIAQECEKISTLNGEIEVDESYFFASFHSQLQAEVARRVRGKRGRGAGKKTSVFGMLKRNNCVYTQIVKHCLADELLPIIRDLSDISKTEFYSDCWGAYDGLVDFGAKAHYRVKHSKNEFALGKNNINGIENVFASLRSQL